MQDYRIREIREVISRVLNGEVENRVREDLGGEYSDLAKDVNHLLDLLGEKSTKPSWQLSDEAQKVLDALPMEVVIFDPDLKYQYVNPIAVKDPEIRSWIIGKDDYEYCAYRNKDSRIAEARQSLLKKAIHNRKLTPLHQKMTDPNGQSRHYLRTVHPVFDEVGSLRHLIGCSYEVTDLKEKESE